MFFTLFLCELAQTTISFSYWLSSARHLKYSPVVTTCNDHGSMSKWRLNTYIDQLSLGQQMQTCMVYGRCLHCVVPLTCQLVTDSCGWLDFFP